MDGGTPLLGLWTAPEVIAKKAYDSSADAWSFGIFAVAMTLDHASTHVTPRTRSSAKPSRRTSHPRSPRRHAQIHAPIQRNHRHLPPKRPLQAAHSSSTSPEPSAKNKKYWSPGYLIVCRRSRNAFSVSSSSPSLPP